MLAAAQLTDIEYLPSSVDWFVRIRHLPHAVWLDSGRPQSVLGRFDVIAAAPAVTLETNGINTAITQLDGAISSSTLDPLQLVQQFITPTSPIKDIPFVGGALGYFAYDLGRRLEALPQHSAQDIALPEMQIGIYPWAIIQDHREQKAYLVTNQAQAPAYNFLEIQQITAFHEPKKNIKFPDFSFKISKFEPQLNAIKYANAIGKIHAYIAAGDCYQVNFAQRFNAKCTGDSLSAYLALREVLPSPFSAYLQFTNAAILSLSPERFIQVRGDQVETKPIKGTIARGLTADEDHRNAATLQASSKDRAENLMIVDLLRNDLSKTCTEVKVPALFELQSFANVHHLVSTVTGTLKPHTTALDVLASSFPGGSITGAPKIRAMEIIEELEPSRRSLYCGSVGYISSCGNMDTSIAIRTLVCAGEKIFCWGGGGIVADSNTEQEYQESIAKVKVLMDTLEKHFS